jgi:nucleotide-binding universal stress UspA family protein
MLPRIEIPDDKRQQAYLYYTSHPNLGLKDIEAYLGVGASTFVRLRERWGWPPRHAALAQNDLSKASQDTADVAIEHAVAATSLREAARSLARATRTQINALMEKQRSEGMEDHDKLARTLASYAKTLTTARALLEQEGARLDETEQHDDNPRSLHELREELARHLERVIAEEEARGSDGLLI